MKGRFYLTGIILLVLFTAAVSHTLSDGDAVEEPPLSVDIVVVGSGIPALTAALEATRLGAEVLLLDNAALRDEFMPPLGGRFVGLASAGDGEEETESGRLMEAIREASPGVQEALLEGLLSAAAETLDWLTRETGLSFSFEREDPYHSYSPSFADPEGFAEELRASLLPRLAVIIPDGEPLEIKTSPAGRVEGLLFKDKRGREKIVMAQALILAPGGYLDNRDFMETYTGEAAALPLFTRQSGTGGEAYDLTRALRPRVANPETIALTTVLLPLGVPVTTAHFPQLTAGYWFDGTGAGVTTQAVDALSAGRGRLQDFLLTAGGDMFILFPAGQEGTLPGLKHIGSCEELAEFTEIPRQRCEEINQNLPLPYAVGRLAVEAFYNMGGLATDPKGRVLGPAAVIPGLYALGEAAGSLHGQGIYPGLPLTEALIMGRRVGGEAALFARQ